MIALYAVALAVPVFLGAIIWRINRRAARGYHRAAPPPPSPPRPAPRGAEESATAYFARLIDESGGYPVKPTQQRPPGAQSAMVNAIYELCRDRERR